DLLVDVHEHDAAARVGEDLRERKADVAGPDDRDVRFHAGESVPRRVRAIRSDASPSPYSCGRLLGIRALSTASSIRTGSSSTRPLAPTSTVSTHSVDGRSVTQGTPYQYASFWSPPESVMITRACDASAAKSR